MFWVIFLSIIVSLINYNYIINNESILLCVIFIIFFISGYNILKKLVKNWIFVKILKNFFYILIVLRINNYCNKFWVYCYTLKSNILTKFKNRIILLKNKNIINVSNLFNYYLILFNLVYFYSLIRNIKNKLEFFNLYFYSFLKKIKSYDYFLFF